jgi:tetratricopeptide (TPR) repeat protein
MKECPACGGSFPDPYQFCPNDGAPLPGTEDEPRELSATQEPTGTEVAQIRVRTLMISLAILLAAGVTAFGILFFYQYLKPKYGELVIKTTPTGASVFLDGKLRGPSPITISNLSSGTHQLRATKEGYKDLLQQVEVMPYATENLHWNLDPLVPHLSNEQLAEVEAWRKKLDNAQKEGILLPPPDDYNVLYFLNKILHIDPANSYALDARNKMAESIRASADLAYAKEDWLEAEKQYKNLALIFTDDIAINERLADIATKIDASIKDREKQIDEWKTKAESAMKAGGLLPPEKDNAFESLQNILRLDRKNMYARGALVHLKELSQTRGDTKISSQDWQAARNEFRQILQYFPEDSYSKSRLSMAETKLAETGQAEQLQLQRLQRAQEEQQYRQKIASQRQSALNSFRSASYQKAIAEWQDYLKFEPNSDEAYYYLGAAYQEEKQFDTAILHLEKCLALNANNAAAHLALGILYDHHRNNLTTAADHLKRARELGGFEKYGPERIQAMIQDLQDRLHLASLQKAPFAAEHKHAFSNCRGNFSSTDAGVEYKTTETDHSFYETYAGLRSFSVTGDDLAIRTRNNKKYNIHLLNSGDGAKIRLLVSKYMQISD